ncbi:response regulator [Eubacterium sp. AF15-50]|uniref:response regulator transcription factor n=1 Tax=Eubacterium sp. AF15-50 TaxID=2293103 RepID=UPI002672B19F|nr:response regulator [Eubacterium sp. AF15-50]
MKTLLLVEDEKLIRQGVRSMIERSGVEIENIIECNNGEAALEILKNQEVDVMFTDIRMPKMDGITLVSKASEFKKKPLIAAVSGFDDFDYAVGMLRNGVQEYILKPVDRKKITETLVKFEDIYEAEQEKYMQERNVAFQQLKYMIFCDDITVAELENTCNIIHKYIPFDKYAVFCFSAKEDDNEFTEKDKYFYVQGRDSLNFIITDAQYFNDVKAKLQHYYVGVSLVYENFFDVKQAFCEAAQMRRFSFEKCEKLVDADGFKELPKDFEYGVKYMMQTANLICSNKLEEAISQLTAFSEGVKSGKYNINEFQEQMKIIIRTTMKVYKNVLANKEEDINELADIYAFETIDVYMDVIKEWINHFNELVGQDIDEHKTNIKMQKAIEYIKEKYATDLNMAVVSNYISMNYSLFSYTFKQYTGTNFVNYLKNIRVGEAKKLLTETDMKINEISQAVGYDHEKHFMKTFKSITGLTPSQYRNNLG